MFQEKNIAETFQLAKTQQNKNISNSYLSEQDKTIEEFRKQLFIHCGINLSTFKLPAQTQAVS
jgi:hypothetical protein